ncbi:MAG TPA: 2-oxo-4-hydroxy-4-carboxy-5-ureidoimidazoline decarboxylase [Ferruginibacter sp.]|nr:2-oxo-4-hydroxy-4-carboxy-5-ureidoimidazoline decarboxylase [Ferruginibacter sp.]
MNLANFNELSHDEAVKLLSACCASEHWVSQMVNDRPFANELAMITAADEIWYHRCNETDWLQSFEGHPKIGDAKSLAEKFANTRQMAIGEQAGAILADENMLQQLAAANEKYLQKNGFIFIVCATGKSAGEMLHLLQARLQNTKVDEISQAMGEQQKITILRIKKHIHDAQWQQIPISQLTTHVLDTSFGKPAHNMLVKLYSMNGKAWQSIAQGLTNIDGRVADLLPPVHILKGGCYKLVFDTSGYYDGLQIKTFYPEVEIRFTISDASHYHVPLLINPFGYTTYRGS